MSNKFPLPLVSMTAMGVYVITGCLAPADALSCFSNSSVIIMGSMFIVAGGLNRTQMVHKVTDLAYKISGGSFQKGMILYCLVTLAIAQVAPSAILIFSICYPLVADFCRKNNQSPSKAMFSIVLISICTVTSFPSVLALPLISPQIPCGKRMGLPLRRGCSIRCSFIFLRSSCLCFLPCFTVPRLLRIMVLCIQMSSLSR